MMTTTEGTLTSMNQVNLSHHWQRHRRRHGERLPRTPRTSNYVQPHHRLFFNHRRVGGVLQFIVQNLGVTSNTDSSERKKTALDVLQWEPLYFQSVHTCRSDPIHLWSAGFYTPRKQMDLQGLNPPMKFNTESVLCLPPLQLLHAIPQFPVLTKGIIFQLQGLLLKSLFHILALVTLSLYLERRKLVQCLITLN